MKRVFFLSFLLGISCTLLPHNVEAQFWRKLFGKEEKKPVRKPVQKPQAPVKKTTPEKSVSRKDPEKRRPAASVKKDRYRVDVLAQLYLPELVKDGKTVYKTHLPDKVLPGLNFYQGLSLAADTLDGLGHRLDVCVHDIADPAKTVDILIKAGKLDSADLIIGAVQPSQVAALAALAKKRNINFVSALSPVDAGVKSNLYFNLIQPTLQGHCEALKKAIAKKVHRNTNVLMYYRSTVPVDAQCFRYLREDSAFAYTRVLVNTPLANDKLRNFLDSESVNIVVMPIVDTKYASQLLEQLGRSFSGYQFEVYGMPSWKGMNLLHKEGSLSNVGITVPSPFYFDPFTSAGKGFSDAFNERFGGRPSELSYRGYETLFWYAYLLQRYGTVFNDHLADNGVAPFTRFDLKPSQDKDGNIDYYENAHVYLYRYQGGSFSVEQ